MLCNILIFINLRYTYFFTLPQLTKNEYEIAIITNHIFLFIFHQILSKQQSCVWVGGGDKNLVSRVFHVFTKNHSQKSWGRGWHTKHQCIFYDQTSFYSLQFFISLEMRRILLLSFYRMTGTLRVTRGENK